jgi:2-haloalkanoic acid dehalogenase type II
MNFKAVLFDGYGTLFEDAMIALKEVSSRVVRRNSLAMGPDDFLAAWDRHFFPLIQGDFVTLREADLVSLEHTFREFKVEDEAARYIDFLFERFNNATVYPDVVPTLEGLDGYITGLLSNADAENIESVLKASRLQLPIVVTSESARCYKPAPGIFQEAINLLGCKPSEVLYVGDSPEDDIVGAKGAGIRVVWLNRRGEALKQGIPRPDYEIESLSEVLKIV